MIILKSVANFLPAQRWLENTIFHAEDDEPCIGSLRPARAAAPSRRDDQKSIRLSVKLKLMALGSFRENECSRAPAAFHHFKYITADETNKWAGIQICLKPLTQFEPSGFSVQESAASGCDSSLALTERTINVYCSEAESQLLMECKIERVWLCDCQWMQEAECREKG